MILDRNINPLWLLNYLAKDENVISLDTLQFTIEKKIRFKLDTTALCQILVYCGFIQCNRSSGFYCRIRGRKTLQ